MPKARVPSKLGVKAGQGKMKSNRKATPKTRGSAPRSSATSKMRKA